MATPERRSPGAVRDEIVGYLRKQEPKDASVAEIVSAVSSSLGSMVPSSSVRSYLNLNAQPKGSGAFIRTRSGRYKLARR